MAGHNKWSKIKRKKGVADAKRSKVFSKLIKEITVATREGDSGDPNFNPRLRVALTNSKAVNLPKETIERAIKKALDGGGAQIHEVTYEGYSAGGVAIFMECATDNLNRTVANIRSILTKGGGSLATSGSVDFMFERKGIFVLEKGTLEEEDFIFEMIDCGAEDVELDEGEFTITTSFENFGSISKKLDEMNLEPKSSELQRIPLNYTALDLEPALKALKLIDNLEDDEDIQAVFHNLELSEEILNALEEE